MAKASRGHPMNNTRQGVERLTELLSTVAAAGLPAVALERRQQMTKIKRRNHLPLQEQHQNERNRCPPAVTP